MSRKQAQRLPDHDLEAYVTRTAHVPAARKHYAVALSELIKREARGA